jgi:endonuclease/exonuclease/phosphatase (EEP) superfamily protein YafD
MRPQRPFLSIFFLALTVGACATATNYTDPEGPAFAGAPTAPTAPASRPLLRIATYNIAHAVKAQEAGVCLGSAPLGEADVVLLQEMDAPQTKVIADTLSLGYVYYPASLMPGERDMGNAILSPWPITETRKIILPHTSHVIHRERIATVATVTIDGTAVRVYSIHLTSPLGGGGGVRGDQADAVVADMRSWDGPIIAGGDLNSRSVGERFEAAGLRWMTKDLRNTVGPFTFDHLFVRGFDGPAVAEVVRSCREPSDHLPVVTEIQRPAGP